MSDAKRLDSLQIGEVSGVDHPAHLVEGWVLMKSLTGLSDEDLAEVVAEAQEMAKAQSQPPSEEIAMSENNLDDVEDVLKALPEPVRKMVAEFEERATAAEAAAAEALTEVSKSREVAADEAAVTKAKESYSNIPGLDPATFGPALRKAAEAAPDAVAEIEKALSAAHAALGVDSALMQEVGSSAAPAAGGDTFAHIQTLAKSLVQSGEAQSIEEGVAKALFANPSLYEQYQADQRGA